MISAVISSLLCVASLLLAPVEPTSRPTTGPSTRPALIVLQAPKEPTAILFHLPGIAGRLRIDDALLRGLVDGRPSERFRIELYNWPAYDRGMGALVSMERNKAEAKIVAARLRVLRETHPKTPIYLTGHSGGAGVAAWALEDLPEGVRVDQLLLLANALSPGYDLTAALKHVSGKCYAVNSLSDPVLPMCAAFGTIDRVRVRAAGLGGFEMTHEKLVEMPYKDEWMNVDNLGDHVGPMQRAFAAKVLAPLLMPASVNTR